jgi:hypothetical protein
MAPIEGVKSPRATGDLSVVISGSIARDHPTAELPRIL